MPRAAKPIPFGKYELLEKIAVGGMAEIFKARTSGVGGFEKYLAIKRILPHLSENKEFIDMLINEAKIAVRLSHANIVQIYDLGKIDDSYFIAMEYIEGKDLRAVMQRCEEIGMPLFVQHAVFITIEVCKGLEYAHSKNDTETAAGALQELNIVHRDISPQNVMISYEGEVKITDFGIAKASVNVNQTEAGVVKGKYEYMSPEQASGLPVDRRTDIFSTGIVLYEMLTGVRPFRGDSDLTILERVRDAKVDPPSKYNKSVPRKLEKIVLKALSKEPDDRYQTATDFKDDLTKFFYSSTFNFTTSNLASYMKSIYSEEIRLDVTIDVDGTGVKRKVGSDDEPATRTGTSKEIGGNKLLDIESEINRILVPGSKKESASDGTAASANSASAGTDPDDDMTETSISDRDIDLGEDFGDDFEIDEEFAPDRPSETRPRFDAVSDLTDDNLMETRENDATKIQGNGAKEPTANTRPNIDPLDMKTATTDRTTADQLNPLDAQSDTLVAGTGESLSAGAQGGAVPSSDSTVITSSPSVAPNEAPKRGGSNPAVGPKIKFTPRVVKERVRGRTVNAAVDAPAPSPAPRAKPARAKKAERTVIGVRPAAQSEPEPSEPGAGLGDQVTVDLPAVEDPSRPVSLTRSTPSQDEGTNITKNPLDMETGTTNSTSTDLGPAAAAIRSAPAPDHTAAVPRNDPIEQQSVPTAGIRPPSSAVSDDFSAGLRPKLHPMVLVACIAAGFFLGVLVMFVVRFL